jgi:hypothetical protein
MSARALDTVLFVVVFVLLFIGLVALWLYLAGFRSRSRDRGFD